MEIAKLILEYIKVLIYPLVAFSIFFVLRNEIKDMLTGELSAKYKGLSLTIKKKEDLIKAMEENIREVTEAVNNEIKNVVGQEKWSGFDHEINRLSSALRKIDLSSDQHMVLDLIRKKHGYTSVADLVNEIIKPGPHMEAHEFQMHKQRLDLALDGLKEKGIVSQSEKGKLKLHPWVVGTTSANN